MKILLASATALTLALGCAKNERDVDDDVAPTSAPKVGESTTPDEERANPSAPAAPPGAMERTDRSPPADPIWPDTSDLYGASGSESPDQERMGADDTADRSGTTHPEIEAPEGDEEEHRFGNAKANEPMPDENKAAGKKEKLDEAASLIDQTRRNVSSLEREVKEIDQQIDAAAAEGDASDTGLEQKQRELEKAVKKVSRTLEELERELQRRRG